MRLSFPHPLMVWYEVGMLKVQAPPYKYLVAIMVYLVEIKEETFSTRLAYSSRARGSTNAMKRSCICYLQPMIPPKRFDIFPPDRGMLRRSRCVQIFSLNISPPD